MCTVIIECSKGIICICSTLAEVYLVYLRVLLLERGCDFNGKVSCNILSCRGRKVYIYGDTRVIHCREELHLHHWSQNIYCKEEESQCYCNNALSVAYCPV